MNILGFQESLQKWWEAGGKTKGGNTKVYWLQNGEIKLLIEITI